MIRYFAEFKLKYPFEYFKQCHRFVDENSSDIEYEYGIPRNMERDGGKLKSVFFFFLIRVNGIFRGAMKNLSLSIPTARRSGRGC